MHKGARVSCSQECHELECCLSITLLFLGMLFTQQHFHNLLLRVDYAAQVLLFRDPLPLLSDEFFEVLEDDSRLRKYLKVSNGCPEQNEAKFKNIERPLSLIGFVMRFSPMAAVVDIENAVQLHSYLLLMIAGLMVKMLLTTLLLLPSANPNLICRLFPNRICDGDRLPKPPSYKLQNLVRALRIGRHIY